MFSSVQNRLESTLSYFGYGSQPSLPREIHKSLENQKLEQSQTSLKAERIKYKPPSIWQRVAALGMNYLLFSVGQNTLQKTTAWNPDVGVSVVSEAFTLPLTSMVGMFTFFDVAYAQSSQTFFFKAFGGESSDYGEALIITPEGDFVIAGNTNSFGAGFTDVLLAKFSSNGTLVWANTLGGESYDRGKALATTSEGDLFLLGDTESSGFEDVLLAKYSKNGTLLWANTIGGVNIDQGIALTSLSDGDCIVMGNTRSTGAGNHDVLLAKFSSNGTLLWVNTVGGALEDKGYTVTASLQGDIFVVGNTNSFSAGNDDVLLIKYSSTGTLLWAKTLGGSAPDSGRGSMATLEGDLIVTGFTTSFGGGTSDALLAKYSSNGTLLWANILVGVSYDWSRAVTTTSEGDLIVTGYTASFSGGNEDVLLAKYSRNGTLVWASVLGGSSDDQGVAITSTSQGNLIIVGYTDSFGAGGRDVQLAKLNTQGGIEDCSVWQNITPQFQRISPILADITLNMTLGMPPWTIQDARSALNVTDISNLLNQTTVCYAQTAVSRTSATPTHASLSSKTPLSNSQDSRKSDVTSTWSSLSMNETRDVSEPSPTRGGTILSITTLVYEESYPIIVNGETIGTFYFTGGSGQLDSDNVNTLNIQIDGDILDGETITLFTIPEGEEPLWEDIVLSDGTECVTTEGAFTTSEEEHSYQLIFQHESSECSQYTVTLKLSAIPILGGGLL